MKLMLLGIAIIIFGAGLIIPGLGLLALWGFGISLIGLVIVFIGFFKKENK